MELTEPGLRVKNAEKMQQSKRASGEEIRPAVSVIMPVYNGEKYIAQAVQSVYAQNIPLELIVIDDVLLMEHGKLSFHGKTDRILFI